MAARNDEGPGRHPSQSSSYNSDEGKNTATLRPTQRATPLVYAEVREVAGRHRDRLEMFVHCPACRALHVHRAPVDFLMGKRTAACGYRYTVIAGIARAVAA